MTQTTLENENFALAANQCHQGAGDEYGNHRCGYQDQIEYWKGIVRDCIEVAEVGFGKPTKISRADAQNYIDRIKSAKEKLNG